MGQTGCIAVKGLKLTMYKVEYYARLDPYLFATKILQQLCRQTVHETCPKYIYEAATKVLCNYILECIFLIKNVHCTYNTSYMLAYIYLCIYIMYVSYIYI